MKARAQSLAMLLLVSTAVWSKAVDERWLEYDQPVTLRGTLLKRYHTEWIDLQGDTPQAREWAKMPAYILRLRSPVSVRASGSQDEERNVREIFLAGPPENLEKQMQLLAGKRVTVTGRLEHATTVHHQRPVMIQATSIQ